MIAPPVKNADIDKELFVYACDFETTTGAISKDQTRVWSFCYDEVGEYKPQIYGSIDDFFDFCGDPEKGVRKRLYFHNLKFDGEFILYEALKNRGLKTALDPATGSMLKSHKLINNEIVYAISDVGQWYFIAFVYNNCKIEIRDSLKLLPMTLESVGKYLCQRYKKSSMNYDEKASLQDCSAEDIDYIKNDVLVLSEALDFILGLHGNKSPFDKIQSLTIGGACWQKFKSMNYGETKNIAIHLDTAELPPESGSDNMDEYIRHGYRGGYCYVHVPVREKILDQPGYVMDVNSLYPYVLCTEYSGFVYPYGKGHYYKGNVPDNYITDNNYYFYARILASFEVKSGFVPTLQKKGSYLFAGNEYLQCSRHFDTKRKVYAGKLEKIEMTLSKDDFILFFNHYNVIEYEPLDYIAFMTAPGLCDAYIKDFEKIKTEATNSGNKAERQLAKLFSNNLYGQFAKSNNSSFKLAAISDENDATEFHLMEEHNKKVINIAIGAAVTAHARFYQLTTIQNNMERFCYSDTDSLHCIGDPADFIGNVHPTNYGAYKLEGSWKRAKFLRQKTYIEEDDAGYLSICCAGMTERQKEYFRQQHRLEDFRPGLTIHGGKLIPKHVPGGVILEEVDFTIK